MERLDTQHRWLDLLTGLGVPAKFLRNRHGPCPMCPRQPEVRMSMCPVVGTLVPSGIHRRCRIVAGLAACSASLPRKSKHGHTWPPPRARVVARLGIDLNFSDHASVGHGAVEKWLSAFDQTE